MQQRKGFCFVENELGYVESNESMDRSVLSLMSNEVALYSGAKRQNESGVRFIFFRQNSLH